MSLTQNGDVLLEQLAEDGGIEVIEGLVTMSGGLETAAFLSIFGGNDDDDGRHDSSQQWWGNFSEPDTSKQYRSETQFLLKGIPLTSGNLRRIEDAATRDLAWFKSEKIASTVEVRASVPTVDRLQLDIRIEAFGEESEFRFVENWKSYTTKVSELVGVVSTPSASDILLEDGELLLLEDGEALLLE
tara:strand:- start:703 stop:1263 length:561 start_codon:yes stop_codon:yes gene_type:complete